MNPQDIKPRVSVRGVTRVTRIGQTTSAVRAAVVPKVEGGGAAAPQRNRRAGGRIARPRITYRERLEQFLLRRYISVEQQRLKQMRLKFQHDTQRNRLEIQILESILVAARRH